MSQEGYGLFNNLYGLCFVLLQVIFLLIIWVVFFRPEKEKKTAAPVGVFAAVNVVLYLCPVVPTWVRHAVSAALVLGYSRIKYGRHLEKAVFMLPLFYNFYCMSFLITNSIHQYLMDDMLSRLDVQSADYMLLMYKSLAIGQSLNGIFYTLAFLFMAGIIGRIVKKSFAMNWYDAMFLSALNIVGIMLAWMVADISAVQIEQEVFFLFNEGR